VHKTLATDGVAHRFQALESACYRSLHHSPLLCIQVLCGVVCTLVSATGDKRGLVLCSIMQSSNALGFTLSLPLAKLLKLSNHRWKSTQPTIRVASHHLRDARVDLPDRGGPKGVDMLLRGRGGGGGGRGGGARQREGAFGRVNPFSNSGTWTCRCFALEINKDSGSKMSMASAGQPAAWLIVQAHNLCKWEGERGQENGINKQFLLRKWKDGNKKKQGNNKFVWQIWSALGENESCSLSQSAWRHGGMAHKMGGNHVGGHAVACWLDGQPVYQATKARRRLPTDIGRCDLPRADGFVCPSELRMQRKETYM